MNGLRRHWKGFALAFAIVFCLFATVVILPFAMAEPWQQVEAEARAKPHPSARAAIAGRSSGRLGTVDAVDAV